MTGDRGCNPDLAGNRQALTFTNSEMEALQRLGNSGSYVVSLGRTGAGQEWASIGAVGGTFVLEGLLHLIKTADGFRLNDGSRNARPIYPLIDEAIAAARDAVSSRMAAFGFDDDGAAPP